MLWQARHAVAAQWDEHGTSGCHLDSRRPRAQTCPPPRLAGADAASGSTGDLLFVPPSEDPLACLLEQHQQQQQQGVADGGYSPSSTNHLEHRLMLTDEVRGLLAVLAPWLATQQPFLLVRLAAARFGSDLLPPGVGNTPQTDQTATRRLAPRAVARPRCWTTASAACLAASRWQRCTAARRRPLNTSSRSCCRWVSVVTALVRGRGTLELARRGATCVCCPCPHGMLRKLTRLLHAHSTLRCVASPW